MHSSILSALLLTFAATATLAFPNGAPGCVVNEQRIGKMGGKNSRLGFSIKPSSRTYQPGKPLKLRLDGPSYYKGLLLFVSSESDDKVRVGNFKIPKGFHSNKDKCDSQGYRAGPNGAITQSNSNKKQPGTEFTWTPEADAACETVLVQAVVAKEQSQWEIVPIVKLHCKDGGDKPAPYDGEEPIPTKYDDKEPEYDQDGKEIEYDQYGDKIEYDEHGNKKPCKKGKKPAADYDGEEPIPTQYDDKEPEYDQDGKQVEYDQYGDKIEYDEQGHKKPCKKGKKPAAEYPAETPSGEYTEGEYEQPAEYPAEQPAGEYESGEKGKKKKKCKKGKKPAAEYPAETPSGEYTEGEYEQPAEYPAEQPAGEYESGEKGKKKKKCKKGKKPAAEYPAETPAGEYEQPAEYPAEQPAGEYESGEKPAAEYPKTTDEYDEHGDKVEYDEQGHKKPCNKGKKPAAEYPAEQPAGEYESGEKPAAEYPKTTDEYDEHGDKVEYDEQGHKKPCNKGKKPEEYTGDKQPAGEYSGDKAPTADYPQGGKQPSKENPYYPSN